MRFSARVKRERLLHLIVRTEASGGMTHSDRYPIDPPFDAADALPLILDAGRDRYEVGVGVAARWGRGDLHFGSRAAVKHLLEVKHLSRLFWTSSSLSTSLKAPFAQDSG